MVSPAHRSFADKDAAAALCAKLKAEGGDLLPGEIERREDWGRDAHARDLWLRRDALSAEERAFFRDAQPWGFILFARNIDEPRSGARAGRRACAKP